MNTYTHLFNDCMAVIQNDLGFFHFTADEDEGFLLSLSLGGEENPCDDLEEVDQMMACHLIQQHLPEFVQHDGYDDDGTELMSIVTNDLNLDPEAPTMTRGVIEKILSKREAEKAVDLESVPADINVFLHLVNKEKHMMGVQMLMEAGCPMPTIKEVREMCDRIHELGWENPATQDVCNDLFEKIEKYQRIISVRMAD